MDEVLLYQNDSNVMRGFLDSYNTFGIFVKVGSFSGGFAFCIEHKNLTKDIMQLKFLHDSLSGNYRLQDMDTDSYIDFTIKKLGKLTVSGRLGGTHNLNYLVFSFEADQTLLYNIIKFLSNL